MVNKILHFTLSVFELSEILTSHSPKSDSKSVVDPEFKPRILLEINYVLGFYHFLYNKKKRKSYNAYETKVNDEMLLLVWDCCKVNSITLGKIKYSQI